MADDLLDGRPDGQCLAGDHAPHSIVEDLALDFGLGCIKLGAGFG